MKYIFALLLIGVLGYGWFVTRMTPPDFPKGEIFLVEENESLKSVSNRLEEKGIISSALFFRTWASFLGKDRGLQLGYYKFDEPIALSAVINRMFVSGPNQPLVKITVPEGSTDKEIADIVQKAIPNISVDLFGEYISKVEGTGKLFPETYFLLPSSDEKKIIDKMINIFNKRYSVFIDHDKPSVIDGDMEVLILASILEGEANNKEDMKIVSGILQNRLKSNMRLQVDVSPVTYKAKGLPSYPINNPGINAIDAVYNPVMTDYMFYLTGKDGKMYYAKTFDEHKRNIAKHLR